VTHVTPPVLIAVSRAGVYRHMLVMRHMRHADHARPFGVWLTGMAVNGKP
jgi:hypothetical protein